MKPTYQQVNDLIAALNHLGASTTKIIKENGQDKAVAVPYKFGSKNLEVRRAAARNLRLLRPYAEEYSDLRNNLLMDLTEGRGHITDEEKGLNARFNLALGKLDRTAIGEEVVLLPIAEADLDLANNAIPPGLVAVLADLEAPVPVES